MKSALFVLVVFATGCTVTHRSQDYACTTQSDCASGRTCSGGFCVVNGSGPPIDSSVHLDTTKTIDSPMNLCPPGCTACDISQKTCEIDCSVDATGCVGAVTCPTGYNCNILCNVADACRAGVACDNSTACTISCSGSGSCHDITCGPGPCNVECSGQTSCRNVNCQASCECDVTCPGSESCSDTVTCNPSFCTAGLGCSSSEVPECNTCN
jgi:hypothetical protein